MVERGKDHIMPDLASVAYRDSAVILKMTTGVDKHIFAYGDVFTEIRIEGWENAQRLRNFIAEQLGQQPAHFIRRMISRWNVTRRASLLISSMKRWISSVSRGFRVFTYVLKSSIVIYLLSFEFYCYISSDIQSFDTVTIDTAYFDKVIAMRPVLTENRHVAPRRIVMSPGVGAQPHVTPSVVRAGSG